MSPTSLTTILDGSLTLTNMNANSLSSQQLSFLKDSLAESVAATINISSNSVVNTTLTAVPSSISKFSSALLNAHPDSLNSQEIKNDFRLLEEKDLLFRFKIKELTTKLNSQLNNLLDDESQKHQNASSLNPSCSFPVSSSMNANIANLLYCNNGTKFIKTLQKTLSIRALLVNSSAINIQQLLQQLNQSSLSAIDVITETFFAPTISPSSSPVSKSLTSKKQNLIKIIIPIIVIAVFVTIAGFSYFHFYKKRILSVQPVPAVQPTNMKSTSYGPNGVLDTFPISSREIVVQTNLLEFEIEDDECAPNRSVEAPELEIIVDGSINELVL